MKNTLIWTYVFSCDWFTSFSVPCIDDANPTVSTYAEEMFVRTDKVNTDCNCLPQNQSVIEILSIKHIALYNTRFKYWRRYLVAVSVHLSSLNLSTADEVFFVLAAHGSTDIRLSSITSCFC